MGIKVTLSKTGCFKKPSDGRQKGAISNQLNSDAVVLLSVTEFIDAITLSKTSAKSYTPAILSGTRKNYNFVESDFAVLDVDENLPYSDCLTRVDDCKIKPMFIQPTFSNPDPINPTKYRVAFRYNRPITNPIEQMIVQMYLMNSILPEADSNCKDLVRYYFGGTTPKFIDENATIDVDEIIAKATDEMIQEATALWNSIEESRLKAEDKLKKVSVKSVKVIKNVNIPAVNISNFVEYLCGHRNEQHLIIGFLLCKLFNGDIDKMVSWILAHKGTSNDLNGPNAIAVAYSMAESSAKVYDENKMSNNSEEYKIVNGVIINHLDVITDEMRIEASNTITAAVNFGDILLPSKPSTRSITKMVMDDCFICANAFTQYQNEAVIPNKPETVIATASAEENKIIRTSLVFNDKQLIDYLSFKYDYLKGKVNIVLIVRQVKYFMINCLKIINQVMNHNYVKGFKKQFTSLFHAPLFELKSILIGYVNSYYKAMKSKMKEVLNNRKDNNTSLSSLIYSGNLVNNKENNNNISLSTLIYSGNLVNNKENNNDNNEVKMDDTDITDIEKIRKAKEKIKTLQNIRSVQAELPEEIIISPAMMNNVDLATLLRNKILNLNN